MFRGVAKHPTDVLPTGGTNCYYHHSCYGKDGPANCRNESGVYLGTTPGNPVPITTFISGKTPVPVRRLRRHLCDWGSPALALPVLLAPRV